jgi:hypothetical protein
MNSLKSFTKNTINSLKRNNKIYSIVTKNKYRRDIQPGYTRYNWDSMTYDKAPYEVLSYNIAFKINPSN